MTFEWTDTQLNKEFRRRMEQNAERRRLIKRFRRKPKQSDTTEKLG